MRSLSRKLADLHLPSFHKTYNNYYYSPFRDTRSTTPYSNRRCRTNYVAPCPGRRNIVIASRKNNFPTVVVVAAGRFHLYTNYYCCCCDISSRGVKTRYRPTTAAQQVNCTRALAYINTPTHTHTNIHIIYLLIFHFTRFSRNEPYLAFLVFNPTRLVVSAHSLNTRTSYILLLRRHCSIADSSVFVSFPTNHQIPQLTPK